MKPCDYCNAAESLPDVNWCQACEPLAREAFRLLFAGLVELFRAHREQEARDVAA